ncbi:hypothetical protein EV201_1259 [Ancylomarina subtilis]|uniref:Uncharacterized protein n=1 Tax=Ancylomarina subtilis TaxID=1639035 RepID=A0A4Q7VKQ6_9BACT|nr:hypothetical protein [Ancylomarina subtilis]RZT96618.1 hypothetical protein EV201_1259 [Ancylomarina subtilis]
MIKNAENLIAKVKEYLSEYEDLEPKQEELNESENVDLADDEEKEEAEATETEEKESTEETEEETKDEEPSEDDDTDVIKTALKTIFEGDLDLDKQGYYSIGIDINEDLEVSVYKHASSYKEIKLSQEESEAKVVELQEELSKANENFKTKLSELESMIGESNVVQAPQTEEAPIKLTRKELLLNRLND